MTATLKSVQPIFDEHDDFFDFDIDVEVLGEIQTIRHVEAQKLLDQHEFAVLVAERIGCLMRRESDWRHALADAWKPPALRHVGQEAPEEEEEMVLTEERMTIADGIHQPSELLYFH